MGLCLWYLLVDPWEGAARGPAKLCLSFVSGLLCKEGGCHGAVPSLPLWHPQVPAQPPSSLGRAAAGQPRAGDTWSTGVSALSSAAAESRGSFEQLAANAAPAAPPLFVSWCAAGLSVPNEHWQMAHSHCWVSSSLRKTLSSAPD